VVDQDVQRLEHQLDDRPLGQGRRGFQRGDNPGVLSARGTPAISLPVVTTMFVQPSLERRRSFLGSP
jgi:hypothetical protein